MSDNEINTEQSIINAAKKIFFQKGFDGARMQEIANEAGINKALLHYYFRSKDKLFEAIFMDALMQFIPQIGSMLMSELAFKDKIKSIITTYIDFLLQNPLLPQFVIHEINRCPERLINVFRSTGINPDIIKNVIIHELEINNYRKIKPEHLIVNILSMCIFPFATRPLLTKFAFDGNEKSYNAFLEERKDIVYEFVINSITIK